MHVMFIHPNFPAQFGHIANYLATQRKWQCTFVTSVDTTRLQLPFTHINYKVKDGPQPTVFYNPSDVKDLFDHMAAIYRGLRGTPQVRPDLVVGHTSYGTMLYLRLLYPQARFVGYFELLPPPFWGDGLILRKEYPPPEGVRLFNATYHTLTYLHLHATDACYTPTRYQLTTAPQEMQHKIRVIFDGVDCDFFKRRTLPRPTTVRLGHAGRETAVTIGPNTRVVTYVSRGLESIRGFDLFMKAAKRIYQAHPDVLFLIAGEERTNYGHELHHLPKGLTFKQWVLAQDEYDLTKFRFLGNIPPDHLVNLYSLSDLHLYLTVPYVLSWSLMQAMATGCTILGSATAPVQEVIEPDVNGLLADFYDVDGLAEQAIRVLGEPEAYRHLGTAARQHILEKYELKLCTKQLIQLFEEVVGEPVPAPRPEAVTAIQTAPAPAAAAPGSVRPAGPASEGTRRSASGNAG
jgi:glycosyltransferase involved in cell wall biosynthesis